MDARSEVGVVRTGRRATRAGVNGVRATTPTRERCRARVVDRARGGVARGARRADREARVMRPGEAVAERLCREWHGGRRRAEPMSEVESRTDWDSPPSIRREPDRASGIRCGN